MLERIDPYGDLILTSLEMPQLIEELVCICALAESNAERAALTRLEQLAARCRDDDATELHFQGD